MSIKTWDDTDKIIKAIGLLTIARNRLEGKLNEKLTACTAEYQPQIEPLDQEIRQLTDALEAFCYAHREHMADSSKGGGKVFRGIFGKVAFRKCPPSVVFLKKAEKVLAALQAMKLTKFIRSVEEPNKEAMHLLTDEQLEQVFARRQPAEKFEVKPDYKQIATKEEA